MDTLELIFQQKLSAFLSSPDDVSEALEQTDEILQANEALLASVEEDLAKVKKDMDRLYDLYMDESITKTGFKERYSPLEERKHQLTDELPRLQAQIDIYKIQHASHAEIVSEAQELYRNWSTLPFEDKRSIIEAIVDRITIGVASVDIDLVNPERRGTTASQKGEQTDDPQALTKHDKKAMQPQHTTPKTVPLPWGPRLSLPAIPTTTRRSSRNRRNRSSTPFARKLTRN